MLWGILERLAHIALLLLGLNAAAWLMCEGKACLIGKVVLCHQF